MLFSCKVCFTIFIFWRLEWQTDDRWLFPVAVDCAAVFKRQLKTFLFDNSFLAIYILIMYRVLEDILFMPHQPSRSNNCRWHFCHLWRCSDDSHPANQRRCQGSVWTAICLDHVSSIGQSVFPPAQINKTLSDGSTRVGTILSLC